VPSPNGYNWLFEPFDNQICPNCHSPALGVNTDGGVTCAGVSPNTSVPVCQSSQQGTNPALMLQYSGSSTSNPQINAAYMPANSLQRGVWYDIVIHMTYSTTSGAVQWWINTGSGWVPEANISGVPTMYYTGSSSPDCTVPGNSCASFTNLDLELYHYWQTWSQSVYFEDVVTGPTAASVGEPQL
jgi:hypothetical protein